MIKLVLNIFNVTNFIVFFVPLNKLSVEAVFYLVRILFY